MRYVPCRAAVSVILACGCALSPARAADSPGEVQPATPGGSVVTRAGRHDAGGVQRWFFGDDYRDLWSLPFRAEVLDLDRFAGGLTPVRTVGGQQSRGLALRGADGRAYTFRDIEKDATRGLAPDLRETIAGRIAQDQVAALHPAGAVAVAPLLEAAGVLHVAPRIVVMPDDLRLGEFRSEFAGLLGTIDEYPTPAAGGAPGFGGAIEIIQSGDLFARLRANPDERVDSRAFLRARLMDLFVGDWDRHTQQWRWARVPGTAGWQPIPEDRDFALCRFEGVVLTVARNWYPRWVVFDDRYPPMLGITWHAWPLDRALLTDLEKPAWDEIAADLQARLTDDVLGEAVRRLPEEYQRADGERLLAELRGRRDRLRQAADAFYKHLSEEVAIGGTDGSDVAEVVAVDDGVDVTVRPSGRSGASDGEPWYHRRFRRGETSEIRLDLRGGDDRFVARGRSPIRVRVLGGPGDDLLDDSAGGGTRFADWEGNNRVLRGPGTKLDDSPYTPPPLESATPYLPARDWGRQRWYIPWFAASPDTGLLLGAGVRLERYGFRTYPYRAQHVVRAAYAIGPNAFGADYAGELRRENSGLYASLNARASQLGILHFFGFGNDTPEPESETFFEVRQTQLSLVPRIHLPLESRLPFPPRFTVSVGPTFEYASTRRPDDRFVGQTRPYGSEPFGQLGVTAEVRYDTQDVPAYPRRGVLLLAGGTFHPAWWDVREPYGDVHAEASAHLTASSLPLHPTLALRAGAKKVLGTFPFQEAAFVGGPFSVRGFASQRFAGDTSAVGNAELRLFLGRYFFLLPGEYGVFALADTGRVWLDGDSPGSWHTSVGGGLWFAYLRRDHTVSIALARSEEKTGFYLSMGFTF
jgi:Omp85 superfamily domain